MPRDNFRILLVILGVYALLLVFFPLAMQAMEPYAYAAAAEGYYNLTTTFGLFQPGVNLPDISAYHPNHPLGHLLPAFAFRQWGIDALVLARVRNGISALVFLFFFYLSAGYLVRRMVVRAAATAITMFNLVFWNSALSGEVHMPALALNMVAVYFLLVYFKDPAPRYLWIAALFHVFSGASHLTSAFLLCPAGIALLVHSSRREKWGFYLALTAFILAGYAFFYIFLLVKFLKIDSPDLFLRTFFIYTPILTRKFGLGEWWQITGKSLVGAFASSGSAWGIINAVLLILLVVIGYLKLLAAKLGRPQKVLLIGWPLFQIAVQIIVQGRPDGLNFWFFLGPPLNLAMLFSLRYLAVLGRTKLFLVGAVILVFAVNFFTGIFPASRMASNQFLLTERHPEFAGNPPAAFIVNQPVLTFSEIWAAGSIFGLRTQVHFFPCCGDEKYAERLRQWTQGKSRFLIFDDDAAEFPDMLTRDKTHCRTLQSGATELTQDRIPVSVHLERGTATSVRKTLRIIYCEYH